LYFSGGNDLVVEVFYDDFSFLGDWVFVAFDKCFECFLSFFLVKEGVIFDSFDEFVVTFYRGVILENIEDDEEFEIVSDAFDEMLWKGLCFVVPSDPV